MKELKYTQKLTDSPKVIHCWLNGMPGWCHGKEYACQCRRHKRHGSVPGSGKSPGEGSGTHSSTLARKIPWTEESGGLLSMGSRRVGHDRAAGMAQQRPYRENYLLRMNPSTLQKRYEMVSFRIKHSGGSSISLTLIYHTSQQFHSLWSGLPRPPPGNLPDPGIKPMSPMHPASLGGFFTTSATWEALLITQINLNKLGALQLPFI